MPQSSGPALRGTTKGGPFQEICRKTRNQASNPTRKSRKLHPIGVSFEPTVYKVNDKLRISGEIRGTPRAFGSKKNGLCGGLRQKLSAKLEFRGGSGEICGTIRGSCGGFNGLGRGIRGSRGIPRAVCKPAAVVSPRSHIESYAQGGMHNEEACETPDPEP
jgi:hypothetical protein